MKFGDEFDLKSSLDRLFPGLSLGGDLFHQSPIGVRFNIGLAEINRAVLIFNAIFGGSEAIVLLDEDSSWEADPTRWYELFSLPGLIRSCVSWQQRDLYGSAHSHCWKEHNAETSG